MDEIILKERIYRERLTKITNEIGLPALILKPAVKELYEELIKLEQQQFQEAKRQNEEKVQKQKEELKEENKNKKEE